MALKKLNANDPEIGSTDLVAENIKRLQSLFPGLVAEGPGGWAVNVDVLKVLVGDSTVTDADEKYGLTWHGKRRARQFALTPSTGTLRPCREESVDWDTTQNLLIAGDNLEVLKLLQKSFSRRIKAIYIDPPYNTGRNLIYPNDYQDGIRTYLEVTGQRDGGAALTSNPSAGGRFHTNWLSMIYPRLRLARALLSPDGVLICTIDDNEVSQLGVLLREVFEEGNYDHVCVPTVHNPRGVQGKNFSYVHEYAYFVFPSGKKAICNRRIDESEVDWSQFRNWGGESQRTDAKNCFYAVKVRDGRIIGFGDVCPDDFSPNQTEVVDRIAHVYPIDRSGVERKWRYARQSVEAIRDMLRARRTDYGYEIEIGKTFGLYKTVWNDKRYDANDYGTGMVNSLVPGSPFTFPKSVWAVYDCLLAATGDDPNAVVLDFFAGSGTTAHATMKLNRDLGGRRRFVLVQIPEPVADNEAFPTIFEVAKARIRAAGQRIEQEAPNSGLDLGFRVFKLDSSNIRAWEAGRDDLDRMLLDAVDHLKPDRMEADVLYELLLKLGLDLCVPIETRAIAGKDVHAVGGGALMACLAKRIGRDDVEALAWGLVDWHKELAPTGDTTCVFRDSAFTDDVSKTNMAAVLEQRGIASVRSL
ncbi:MAG: site-specific DNA-methyltransferase [Bryobacterales bacterium]|nr:site-specific DNA-methyltransferase [Bryobacterales bacterium]